MSGGVLDGFRTASGGRLVRSPSVVVTGKLFEGRVTSAVVRAAKRTKEYALTQTKKRSRVDTGTMRNSWYAEVSTGSGAVSLAVKNDVFYSKYQEFGTQHIRPMYAATRSIQEARSHFSQELQKELRSELGARIESIEQTTANVLSTFFRGL